MASYTIELRRIIDIYGNAEVQKWFMDYDINDYLTNEQRLKLEELGIFNPIVKERLANKMINHYYMREIGFETPYLFKFNLHVKLDEIMEEKAQLLYSKALELENSPFGNYKTRETFTSSKQGTSQNNGSENLKDDLSKTSTGNSNSTSSATGSSLNVNSDTPQGNINKADILSGKYATTTSANESTNNVQDSTTSQNGETASETSLKTSQNNGQVNETETFEKIKEGNIGTSNNKLLEEYRKNIISIEKQIIEELNPLFMGLLL